MGTTASPGQGAKVESKAVARAPEEILFGFVAVPESVAGDQPSRLWKVSLTLARGGRVPERHRVAVPVEGLHQVRREEGRRDVEDDPGAPRFRSNIAQISWTEQITRR